jgi:hypothetical protein
MRIKEIQGTKEKHIVVQHDDGNITCSCEWSSIHPNAWLDGGKICKHIQQYVKEIN